MEEANIIVPKINNENAEKVQTPTDSLVGDSKLQSDINNETSKEFICEDADVPLVVPEDECNKDTESTVTPESTIIENSTEVTQQSNCSENTIENPSPVEKIETEGEIPVKDSADSTENNDSAEKIDEEKVSEIPVKESVMKAENVESDSSQSQICEDKTCRKRANPDPDSLSPARKVPKVMA